MVVLSNHRLGAGAELLVSSDVASAILAATAEAARPRAQGRWEIELVQWLDDRARDPGDGLDVGEVAWSPEHFERQRQFLIDAIDQAARTSSHSRALAIWCQMFESHGREHVLVGRRWPRPSGSANA